MRLRSILITALFLSAAAVKTAWAEPVTQMVIFGDSLSDTGNSYLSTGGQSLGSFGTNYWAGRFTDGPTTTPATNGPIGNWVDQFSALSGIPSPAPSLAGGTNYAFGGANTGSTQPNDITNQIASFSAAHSAGVPSGALYVLWGGSNDLQSPTNSPVAAADNLYNGILTLAAGGAKTFLWFDLFGSTGAPGAFNQEWNADLQRLHGSGLDVIGINLSGLFSQINANPSAYGFTDVVNPAQGLANVNPNNYLFWDMRRHPTTATDALIANLAFNDFAAAPEPLNTGLVLAGFLTLVSLRQFRQKH